jgi:lysophospholipase L1-like esterase
MKQKLEMNRLVAAFLGSSSTAGKGQAYDWITELRKRAQNARFCFRNFGVGGDLTFNALQRLPQVLACRPAIIVVWVVANDVLASVSAKVGKFFRFWKRLPVEPSPEWFAESIQSIASRLKCGTSARVALCSLPPIGEDLSSANPFQIELNRRIEKYSSIIRDVALNERVGYVPIYEEMAAKIQALPGRAFTSFRFLPFYRDAFRVIILHKSPDEVSQMNGWNFHTDGVHLNSRGGAIVADLVQAFLDEETPCNE